MANELKVLDKDQLAQLWTKCLNTFMQRNGVPSSWFASEYEKTINLFNKLDTSIGGIYSGNGIQSGDIDVRCSGFIEIKPNTKYIHNIVGNWSSGKGLAFYTDKKVYISGYASSNAGFNNFKTPSNAKYIRISYYIVSGTYYTDENTLMLIEGDTLPSIYISHFAPSHFTNEEGTFVKQEYSKSINIFSTTNWLSNRAVNVDYSFNNDSEIAFSNISGSDPYAYMTFKGYIKGRTYTVSIISNQTLQSWSFEASGDNLNQNQSFTFTATETEYEIGFEFASGYSTCNIKIMVNEGSTALPYQEYNGAIIHEKDITPVLLWENGSPGSPFTAQSVNFAVGLDNFKGIRIVWGHGAGNNMYEETIFTNVLYNYGSSLTFADDNGELGHRSFKCDSNTSLYFYNGMVGSSGNSYRCVPVRIYGLR